MYPDFRDIDQNFAQESTKQLKTKNIDKELQPIESVKLDSNLINKIQFSVDNTKVKILKSEEKDLIEKTLEKYISTINLNNLV